MTSLPSRSHYSRSLSISSTPPPSNTSSLLFRSVTAPKRTPSFSLKVIKAKLVKSGRRKPEFEPLRQTYIYLVDSTANLEHILGLIQRWGSQFTLVTSDGIELEESPSTQGLLFCSLWCCITLLLLYHVGLSFWKCPRRKLYAMSRKDLECTTSKKINLSDSDEEDFQPGKK